MAETNKSTTKENPAKTKEETHNEQDELLNRELEDSLTQPTKEMGGPDRKRHKAK